MKTKRPLSVTILACLYLAVGLIGFVGRFSDLLAWRQDAVWIESTEFAGIVCGVFLLLGQDWARWLALAWIAFHVALSIFHPLFELVLHAVFLVVIAWVLLRPPAWRYFRRARV